MNDVDIKASAEANAIKTGDITASANLGFSPSVNLTLNQDAQKAPFLYRVITGVKKAINPTKFEREAAQTRAIKAQADITVYDLYRQNMPWLDEKQAFLFANGYVTTPAQAENVFAVFDGAEKQLEGTDSVEQLPPATLDGIIDGAKTAYDQNIREMWEALIAGEATNPGDYSKRAIQILKGMSRSEAESFRKLCGFSTQYYVENAQDIGFHDPKIVLTLDEAGASFNNGAIGIVELNEIGSIGLINTSMHFSNRFFRNMSLSFIAHDEVITATNTGEREWVQADFEHAIFLPAGRELARACGIGFAPELGDVLTKKFSDAGLSVQRHPAPR